jgi:hypothetical protein
MNAKPEQPAQAAGLDLIKELRLRRWARANYVSESLRSPTWHPIVLEEMSFRDAEVAQETRPAEPVGRLVPLAPTILAGPHTSQFLDSSLSNL